MATGVNDYHLLPIFLISLVVLLSATEFGRWLGTRVSDQGADEVLTLQGAVLGLLALMIAFTFAMALSRFEGRRDAARQHCVRACSRNRTARKR
jgi:cellobiose-specific phosphotransferase system component IIC